MLNAFQMCYCYRKLDILLVRSPPGSPPCLEANQSLSWQEKVLTEEGTPWKRTSALHGVMWSLLANKRLAKKEGLYAHIYLVSHRSLNICISILSFQVLPWKNWRSANKKSTISHKSYLICKCACDRFEFVYFDPFSDLLWSVHIKTILHRMHNGYTSDKMVSYAILCNMHTHSRFP